MDEAEAGTRGADVGGTNLLQTLSLRNARDRAEERKQVAATFAVTGSVRETARQTGIARSTVSRWLRGPAAAELREAAVAYKAKLDLVVQRAWVEHLRTEPPAMAPFEVMKRMELLREAIMAEELGRVRSLRRRRGVQSNAARTAGPR